MADLYGLFGVLDRLEGAHSATERGFIKQTIQKRFWQGGGSYAELVLGHEIGRRLTSRFFLVIDVSEAEPS